MSQPDARILNYILKLNPNTVLKFSQDALIVYLSEYDEFYIVRDNVVYNAVYKMHGTSMIFLHGEIVGIVSSPEYEKIALAVMDHKWG